MGVLNVTPDSFSDGGRFFEAEAAVAQAKKMFGQGTQIIDVGGESTRPGSEPVSEEEELRRVLTVIRETKNVGALVSIDTYKPKVARACLHEGCHLLNDITGFTDPQMVSLASEFGCGVVVMHMKGKPKTMQENPQYKNVVEEIKRFFVGRIKALEKAGVEKIILDPGIGFGKTAGHNLQIIANLKEFVSLGYPVMIGVSRKSFIGKITGAEVGDRLPGTIAANILGLANGARVFRVHDVAENRQALQVAFEAMKRGKTK